MTKPIILQYIFIAFVGIAATACSVIHPDALETTTSRSNVPTEAYGSSPAAYALPADVPAQMSKMLEARPLVGTLRTSFDLSAGGSLLRIRLSNETNSEPLVIEAASVALGKPSTDEPTEKPVTVTFGGKKHFVIPAGAPLLSDPVLLKTKAQDRLVVSLYSPGGFSGVVVGGKGMTLAPGNQTNQIELLDGKMVVARSPVSGVTVEGPTALPVIVTLGDSITDGSRAAADQLAGYPSVLTKRMEQLPLEKRRSVVNAGIAGNRLLKSGWGQSVLARLDRDVFRIPNVSHLVVLVGINDIGLGGPPLTQLETSATAKELIAGYSQIIERARARGIKVIGGTLLPFKGAFYYSEAKDKERLLANKWIRESGMFHNVIDFDLITRDPEDHLRMNPAYDSGDHLHPSDAGYRAMGEAIDLTLFD